MNAQGASFHFAIQFSFRYHLVRVATTRTSLSRYERFGGKMGQMTSAPHMQAATDSLKYMIKQDSQCTRWFKYDRDKL